MKNIIRKVIRMKNLLLLVLITPLILFAACSNDSDAGANNNNSETNMNMSVDSISAASDKYHYEKSFLEGEELTKLINTRQAAFTIATTNADGSPNIAVIIPGALGEDVIYMTPANNQTRKNIMERKLAVMAVYKYDITKEDKYEKNVGARLVLEYIEDKDQRQSYLDSLNKLPFLNDAQKKQLNDWAVFFKVKKVIPLG